MAIKKAIYQVDNGTDFDEIHFKTSAEQVYLTSGANVNTAILNLQSEVSANKTSILSLQEELNGQRLRGIEIANSLLEKL